MPLDGDIEVYTQSETARVLLRAAEIIEERGLNKKGLGIDGGPRCVSGAIWEATGIETGRWDLVDKAPWEAVRNQTSEDYVRWNDAPERTAAEVITALRRAASLADSMRETA